MNPDLAKYVTTTIAMLVIGVAANNGLDLGVSTEDLAGALVVIGVVLAELWTKFAGTKAVAAQVVRRDKG